MTATGVDALPRNVRRVLSPDVKWPVIALCTAIAAWLALAPLLFILWQSFHVATAAGETAPFSLSNYLNVYTSAETFGLLSNSVLFATGAAALALAFGTALAWINERTNAPFKPLVYAISVVPLVIPGLLFVAAWIMLADPKIGILNLVLQDVFGTRRRYFSTFTHCLE